ncbi:MAG: hypothetical protein Tsb0026_12500 [Sulfuricaulis sp.]
MADASTGEKLFALGWRAGSVLPPELYKSVRRYLHHVDNKAPKIVDPKSWLIVASQSCDVVARKEDAEPYVEVLWAHPYDGKPRTQYCDRRSTRRLDFLPNKNAFPDIVLTAHASIDRYVVPRKALIEGRPDAHRTLSAQAIKGLHAWLALRYDRPAWPESFVARINPKPIKIRLLDALKPLMDDIAQVRIGISPKDQELDENNNYKVAVYFVVSEEKYENSSDTRRLVQEGFNKFVSALKDCEGIELDTDLSEVVSGGEFTWEETQSTDLWDFAYLSPLE